MKLNTIEEALADFKAGKFVIVVDDEDRENEGDLICAAEKITPEMVNFMLKNARGVLCAPVIGNSVHGNGRQDRRLFDGRVSPRPSRYHTGTGRSHINIEDLRTPGAHQSTVCSGQWCVAPLGPYGSGHRPV